MCCITIYEAFKLLEECSQQTYCLFRVCCVLKANRRAGYERQPIFCVNEALTSKKKTYWGGEYEGGMPQADL